MQKIEKVKLKNGLEIYFLFDKSFTTSSIQMCFKVGWRSDTEEHRGLAHLFEHLVGKRTKKYPAKSEFSKKLDSLGIVDNAWTGPDLTVYWHNQINENLLKSVDLLFEAIYDTNFVEEDLEKEKEVVLNEARMYKDNDNKMSWIYTMENLFPRTSLNKFFFGDEKTMKNISIDTFTNFYKVYKNPHNSVLFIGSSDSKDKRKIVAHIDKLMIALDRKKLFTGNTLSKIKDITQNVKKELVVKKPGRNQSQVRLAFRYSKKLNTRERVALSVLQEIWTGGLTGKLIKILRDDLGLIYSLGMWNAEYLGDKNYVTFATECKRADKEKVVNILNNYLENYKNDLTQNDIELVIPKAIYRAKKAPSVSGDTEELLCNIMNNEEYVQVKDGLKILSDLKVKDLVKVVSKMFNNKEVSVIFIE